jgi:UDP-glucuronate 4-epimerase
MKILVTGAAGFIGYHLCKKLVNENHDVYGIDNLNSYYDVRLKLDRLVQLTVDTTSDDFLRQREVKSEQTSFRFWQIDLVDAQSINTLFQKENFEVVINLAAQAGVRYSIDNPRVYVQSNVVGFLNILEACRDSSVQHLIYASSSSVYGNQLKVPFSEEDSVDYPVSLYAATKKSNELMAHVYSHLYGLKTTGLRFFTVYGPWGRPDMAPFLFTKAILNRETIKVFNNGDLMRDFTYVDDVIEGINSIVKKKSESDIKYQLYNIGNNSPEKLLDFIKAIEYACNMKADLKMYPMQAGDVYQTFADVDKLKHDTGYTSKTALLIGIQHFVNWYKDYYKY